MEALLHSSATSSCAALE